MKVCFVLSFSRNWSLTSYYLDEDPEEEKEKQKANEEKFAPLIEYIKNETLSSIMNGKSSLCIPPKSF